MKNLDFIKVCSLLDEGGYYKSSDKLEKLVKIAQGGIYGLVEDPAPLGSNLQTTGLPTELSQIARMILNNPADTAMGREYADGRMYDPTAAYEGTGPDRAYVAPYQPSFTEQSQMSPEELMGLTKANYEQAVNYISTISEPSAQLASLFGILGSKGGNQAIKDNIFENTMQSFGANVSRQLMSKPLESWPGIVDTFIRQTKQSVASDKVGKIDEVVKKSLSDIVRNSKLDPQFKNRLKKSPQVQSLLARYNLSV